jgi:tRNA dimethylallyltransferase
MVGLVMDREMLAQRIELRCRQMVQEGLVEEVRRLWDMGYGPELSPMQTIGYVQIGEMLQGCYGMADALNRMVLATKHLAKRQLTWLRAEPDLRWFAPHQTREIVDVVAGFWERLST